MIRLFVMFALLALVAALAAYLAGNPGSIDVQIGAWQLRSSFAVVATALAIWTLAVAGLVSGISALRRHLPGIGPQAQAKKQAKGLALVNKSLVALAAGDHRLAHNLAGQASLVLPHQPILHMIQAEAALHNKDSAAARKHFAALEQSEDGRLLGLRGLLADARTTGRDQEALRLARIAFAENRKSPWVLQTLFSLEVAAANWQAASDALDLVAREKLLDAEMLASHRGALLFAQAAEKALAGDLDGAAKTYGKALKLRPAFTPAVLATVQLAQQKGDKRKAEKQIMAAWAAQPSASLGRAYKGLDPAESRAEWISRAGKLAASNPSHLESEIILADAYLDNHQVDRASPVLARMLQSSQQLERRYWQLRLREATQLQQDTDAIEEALDHAPHYPAYVCGQCGAPTQHWTPLCASCGAFDQLGSGSADNHWHGEDHGAKPAVALSMLGVDAGAPGPSKPAPLGPMPAAPTPADRVPPEPKSAPKDAPPKAQTSSTDPAATLAKEEALRSADMAEKARRKSAEKAAEKPFNPEDYLWED